MGFPQPHVFITFFLNVYSLTFVHRALSRNLSKYRKNLSERESRSSFQLRQKFMMQLTIFFWFSSVFLMSSGSKFFVQSRDKKNSNVKWILANGIWDFKSCFENILLEINEKNYIFLLLSKFFHCPYVQNCSLSIIEKKFLLSWKSRQRFYEIDFKKVKKSTRLKHLENIIPLISISEVRVFVKNPNN